MLKFLLNWGGYFWPWNLLYAGLAFLTWFIILPEAALQNPLSSKWILLHLLKNQLLLWIVFGSFHLVLIKWKLNGTDRKFNIKWMEKNKKFMFSDQVLDNISWTCVSGGIIWTAYEILYFWMIARGSIQIISFSDRPAWFIGMFLLLPFYRETHFYLVHHRNPNSGPWSGMSMHPVEHLLYFSNVLILFFIPAHPIHLLFISIADVLALTPGHTGFDTNLFRGWLPGGDFFHFHHHRHVS
ncbi:MAG: sterol desaturase family protein, partial [Spirochaetaceae bacterium]|nr:sterol desaturase family protein [Spirochaetaceae bacterium]